MFLLDLMIWILKIYTPDDLLIYIIQTLLKIIKCINKVVTVTGNGNATKKSQFFLLRLKKKSWRSILIK